MKNNEKITSLFCVCQYVYMPQKLQLWIKSTEPLIHVNFNCFINEQIHKYFVIDKHFSRVYSEWCTLQDAKLNQLNKSKTGKNLICGEALLIYEGGRLFFKEINIFMPLIFITLTNTLVIKLCPCKTTHGRTGFKKIEGKHNRAFQLHMSLTKAKQPEKAFSNRIFHPGHSMTLGGF